MATPTGTDGPGFWGSGGIPLIGSLAGSAIQAWSQQKSNAASQASILQQEAFQDKQRSTAYQTEVQDMEKAGLNPALAYPKAGGATAMPGASYQAQPDVKNNIVSDAIDAYQRWNINSAQAENIRQQAAEHYTAARNQEMQGDIMVPEWMLNKDPAFVKRKQGMLNKNIDKTVQEAQNYLDYGGRTQDATLKNIQQQTSSARALQDLNASMTNLNIQQWTRDWLATEIARGMNTGAKHLESAYKSGKMGGAFAAKTNSLSPL